MKSAISLVLLGWCGVARADSALDALKGTLATVRAEAKNAEKTRGATGQLTVAKHQLRNWLESRLPDLPQLADSVAFEREINRVLREAGFFCDASCEWFRSGFLAPVRLKRQAAFLVLYTGVGVECGFDESVYVYSWSSDGWKRVWQNEQSVYTEKGYKPQTLWSVLISPYNRANDYLVLTLGSEPWCQSTWHQVYYRAFRLGPDLEAGPLLEGEAFGHVNRVPPILGSVASNDVLVEFTIGRIDGEREAVRHYHIEHGRVRRIDPIALSPRDFVDEWLTHDWGEVAFWTEDQGRKATSDLHEKLHKDFVGGEFVYPTMHCPATPDLWQVGVDFSDPPTPIGEKPNGTYFLVRWSPPYKFTMVRTSDRPFPACNEEDRAADDEPHTLFPVQEWR